MTRKMYSKIISMNPNEAQTILKDTRIRNRNISHRIVSKYVRDIQAGRWEVVPGSELLFDAEGNLLDGQHRLQAVVESGVAIKTMAWFNVPRRIMKLIDAGRARNIADALQISGDYGEVTRDIAAVAKALDTGYSSGRPLSVDEVGEIISQHREAIEYAIAHTPKVASAKSICSAQIRAVIARAWYSISLNDLDEFCKKLITGIGCDSKDRVIVLLRQFLQESNGASFAARAERYGKAQRALILWMQSKNPTRFKPETQEVFPLPQEMAA